MSWGVVGVAVGAACLVGGGSAVGAEGGFWGYWLWAAGAGGPSGGHGWGHLPSGVWGPVGLGWARMSGVSARVGVCHGGEVIGVAEEEVGIKELRLEAERHLLRLIIDAQSAPAIEMYARAYRYLAGGPQPGSVQVKS